MCGTRSLTGIQAFRIFLDKNLKVLSPQEKRWSDLHAHEWGRICISIDFMGECSSITVVSYAFS